MDAITYKGQKVITTELLAQAYETDVKNIQMNFSNQQRHFYKGTHYFKLNGEELRNFKNQPNNIGLVARNASSLYLWTERGANRHSKILDTDKAWEQFENLENTYFRVKEAGNYTLSANLEILRCLNGFANYLRTQRIIMRDKGCSPDEIALMDSMTCKALGLPVPDCLTEPKTFEQLALMRANT